MVGKLNSGSSSLTGEAVLILDYGSQYTQLIARKVRSGAPQTPRNCAHTQRNWAHFFCAAPNFHEDARRPKTLGVLAPQRPARPFTARGKCALAHSWRIRGSRRAGGGGEQRGDHSEMRRWLARRGR